MNEQQVSDCRVRAPFLWKLYHQVYPALYNFSLNSSMNRKKQVMMATICRLCLKKKEKKRKQKSKFYWCIVWANVSKVKCRMRALYILRKGTGRSTRCGSISHWTAAWMENRFIKVRVRTLYGEMACCQELHSFSLNCRLNSNRLVRLTSRLSSLYLETR